jgi:hypothetical protein
VQAIAILLVRLGEVTKNRDYCPKRAVCSVVPPPWREYSTIKGSRVLLSLGKINYDLEVNAYNAVCVSIHSLQRIFTNQIGHLVEGMIIN